MDSRRKQKIDELLRRLEALESSQPAPEVASIVEIAGAAIVDELSRLSHEDWLAVYRRGDNLDAIVMAG